MKKSIERLALLGVVLSLAACGGGNEGPRFGQLSLAITDAPVDDATAVVVEFTGVEVKPAGGEAISFDYDEPRTIDLLALQGGGSEVILDDVTVPAGAYDWVRLKVNAVADGTLDSYITLNDGSQHELYVPSGSQSGLKLVSGFVVPAGGASDFTIDFDLRKSVVEPMNASTEYVLKPALRIVDNAQVGKISGTVDNARIVDGCSPAVYVFSGAGVTPDDVDGTAPDPVSSAAVKLDTGTGQYTYTVAFLAPGSYTVAFTCDAAADDPETSDTLTFVAQDATVAHDQVTTVDFGAPAP